jgi:cobalt/nickel transport system permease protein
MHVPDGFLSAPVAVTTWTVAAGGLAVALRQERRDAARFPAGVLGALAAFVFAAQMVNVPVAPGTSGHLVGATLVALVVGPWRALVVMAVVLAAQATLFQDGGFTSYGANLIDMGLAGAFVGFAVATFVARAMRGLRGVLVGGIAGAFVATLCGAVLTSLWLALSGLYPLGGILPLMLVSHSAIGVLESALTAGILATLLRWRPDLLAGPDGAAGPRRPGAIALGVLGIAMLVGAFVAPFASRLPDGLEHTAHALGFAGRAHALLPPSLARAAAVAGPFAPLVAGLAGTLLVALVAWLAARGLSGARDVPHR